MKGKVKKIGCSVLVCAMLAAGTATTFATINTQTVSAQSNVGALQQTSLTVTSNTATYVRQGLQVAEAEKYSMTAIVKSSGRLSDYKFGICGGTNDVEQCMDFVFSNGEFASYASLYGKTKRTDLGYRRLLTANFSADDSIKFTVLRDGKTFYFCVNDALWQIRELDMLASVPGIAAYGSKVTATNITYTANEEEVDAAIQECMQNYAGYGIGNTYANFAGIDYTTNNSFSVSAAAQNKVFEYTRMAYAQTYEGDVEVSYTLSDLTPLAAADESGNNWPKFALVLYGENGFEDKLCVGVGKKQDRIETYIYHEWTQWYNHADFTGDTDLNSTIDRSQSLKMRIAISNTGYFKTYRIYVNDALFAVRTSTLYGSLQFGFEAEYTSGTVSDFSVTQI